MDYILAIDQGTTANTALIVDSKGKIVSEASKEYPQHYPKPGFVEHNAQEIKTCVRETIVEAILKSGVKENNICAIGITNQRETFGVFDQNSNTEFPLIVWQCRRSQDICDRLQSKKDFLHKKTGLILDPYFSASKLHWLLEKEPAIRTKLQNGQLKFGTIDTFLSHWFSKGELHVSDSSNASRTMLMDINSLTWSDECLDIFNIPKNSLPQIVPNQGPYGKTKGLDFLPDGIPIAAMAGDQQAALIGQTCFNQGDAKATYGTGCFILLNIGEQAVLSQHGLLTSVAYELADKKAYCLEGSAFIAGALIKFIKDVFKIIDHESEIEALAKSVEHSNGISVIPALCGLAAPHWRADAQGAIFGLTLGATKGHIARATLEAIALQNMDILKAMTEDALEPKLLKVDGGASKNDLLMQVQADLLQVPCLREYTAQTTALGAAYLAGLSVGIFSDLAHLSQLSRPEKKFLPQKNNGNLEKIIKQYHERLKLV